MTQDVTRRPVTPTELLDAAREAAITSGEWTARLLDQVPEPNDTDAAFCVGYSRTPGRLVFAALPAGAATLELAYALSEGDIEDIVGIDVDGQPQSLSRTAGTTVAGGRHITLLTDNGIWARVYLDSSDPVKARANGASLRAQAPEWTTDHVLPCAWAHVRTTARDVAGAESAYRRPPVIEWLVKGQRITWPGQTSPAWTRNAAAIRYWYETALLGNALDTAEATAAITHCGVSFAPANKPYPMLDNSGHLTYAIDGVLYAGRAAASTRAAMDAAMCGTLVHGRDGLMIRAGIARSPTMTIDASNILEVLDASYQPDERARINGMSVGLAAALHDRLRPMADVNFSYSTLVSLDGETLRRRFQPLQYVADPYAMGFIARTLLLQARGGATFIVRCVPGGSMNVAKLNATDVVTLTLPAFGAQSKRCVVMRRSFERDGSVLLTLRQEYGTAYRKLGVLPPPPLGG